MSIACISKVSKSCHGIALLRGSCKNCYGRLCAMVRKGETTWEKLMAEGKAVLPKKNDEWNKYKRKKASNGVQGETPHR